MRLLARIGFNFLYTPGLVQRCPDDNAGVVVVAPKHVQQFAVNAVGVLLGVEIGSADLAPDEQTHAVSMIEIARILHLLVLANTVEAHRLCQLDVPDERLVRRRGQQ